ncbi:MAG: MAPEG family protein [Rhodobacter sp.]|uniref:MAPEG family protein n=1 Tax=Pararhodobacter sp. TaxID=2127056 RepID=UPI002D0A92E4|nr:MAPEG family protein [Pararhodobacter sp.]MCC0073233.1 MAPEG family protein [Rhodobacter sp.]HPD94074.1 MAPEG family protein [Pararhodobacter sp.]
MGTKRAIIAASMALALVWSLALVWLAPRVGAPDPVSALVLGFVPAGLVMAVMIGRLAQRRFFDDAIIDGAPFVPGSGPEIDQRVLTNTTEQLVLALALWPFAGWVLGWALLPVLGLNFAVMRVLFWLGYHQSPPLRGLGFAASFYPTPVAALWALGVWL